MNSIVTVRLATKGKYVDMEAALPKRSVLFFRIQHKKIFKHEYGYYIVATIHTNNSECLTYKTAGNFP
jgi:hypothetical protein